MTDFLFASPDDELLQRVIFFYGKEIASKEEKIFPVRVDPL